MFVINSNNRQSYLGGYAPTSGCYMPAIDGSTMNLYFNKDANRMDSSIYQYCLPNGFCYSTILVDEVYPNIYLCTSATGCGDFMGFTYSGNYGCFTQEWNALSLTPLKAGTIGKKIWHNLFYFEYGTTSQAVCRQCSQGHLHLCLLHEDGTSTCIANLLSWDMARTGTNETTNLVVHCGSCTECPYQLKCFYGLPTYIETQGVQIQDGDLLYLNACTTSHSATQCTGMAGFTNGTFNYLTCMGFNYGCPSRGNQIFCSYHCYPNSEYRTFPIQISIE